MFSYYVRLKKQNCYESFDISKIIDNKNLWKTINPLLSNKTYLTTCRKSLLENGVILSEESKVADTFTEFSDKVVK